MAQILNIEIDTIVFIILGGVLPVVVWLWFWLSEDRMRPEPRGLIIVTFLAGGLATLPAVILEKYVSENLILTQGLLLFATWAFIEEAVKFAAAFLAAENTRSYDEPIDSIVYMITAALGFAAFENILFLFENNESGLPLFEYFLNGNLRFLGANILHAVASGAAGGVMAFAFYKRNSRKFLFAVLGLATATLLHTIFNNLIMGSSGGDILITFAYFWLAATAVIFMFEKVKRIRKSYV